ncbi:tRNA (adenosine(37)-N6)-threonylcarbamoyltransferase complex transferase subunit TsaD [Maritalea porphyrae]|uniref:tRNA (adenosine(37)-N6)-threonylcarbamoyltransferase complex transferase subunit TsaD n=1 Tax=Maritalea porphyrae TaxID=880732 RepID=UPI0022AEDE84|nr:tRNA (adenosine(37)-N6)-threonylcarbamoyltransferase complex transferase subunit TsaD [Maritalea porphyrae]MCZ4272402.1 tRNA (adenosine(37)-N6)-threonylcarbamoyltransferase complex transferase subunit TsaD [Maritalea porphyrae]
MSQARTIILGIETSCDETAAAIVARNGDGTGHVLSNIVRTQLDEHKAFGGVVPEIAARSHVQWLDHIVAQALDAADLGYKDIDGVAATAGPGLIGGVLVGLTTAKAIAKAIHKPLIAVNHLEGHALTARLTNNVPFPFLLLLVSGGHSQFVLVRDVGDYERWGTTIDDALGEAFDKVAKMLNLGFPGGPKVEEWAKKGDAKRFKFPRPLLKEKRLDFSFSGLKTAVRLAAEAAAPLSDKDVADICAGFQSAVVAVLQKRCGQALERFADELPGEPIRLVVAGGVAANQEIGDALHKVAGQYDAELIVPPMNLCTDNGAMIAWAGAERLVRGQVDKSNFAARPRWPLDSDDMGLGDAHG